MGSGCRARGGGSDARGQPGLHGDQPGPKAECQHRSIIIMIIVTISVVIATTFICDSS